MNVTVYGDFNSLLSYLASQQADWLVRTATAEIDWQAVEHCCQMPVTGIRSDPGDSGWQRELAETGALALPGERLPAAPPPVVSNTRASVAAYAEAVTDGVEDELRRRLFEAIWAQRRNLSGPYDVRGVIAEVMWPTDPIYFHGRAPTCPIRSSMTPTRCGSCAGKAGRSRPASARCVRQPRPQNSRRQCPGWPALTGTALRTVTRSPRSPAKSPAR